MGTQQLLAHIRGLTLCRMPIIIRGLTLCRMPIIIRGLTLCRMPIIIRGLTLRHMPIIIRGLPLCCMPILGSAGRKKVSNFDVRHRVPRSKMTPKSGWPRVHSRHGIWAAQVLCGADTHRGNHSHLNVVLAMGTLELAARTVMYLTVLSQTLHWYQGQATTSRVNV